MNIQEYISSGILESYIMGLTTEAENKQVEKYALEYPEIKAELDAIEESLLKMADSMAIKPPAHLKENIFAGIRESENGAMPKKVIQMQRQSTAEKTGNAWWAAAAVVLLVVSAAINVLLFTRWKTAERELATINNEKEILANQYKIDLTKLETTSKEMAILKQPGNKMVTLKGSKIAPDAMAMIYWNNSTADVYVNVANLPAPPSGMQYQLWAIVDGKPVDAGMLPVDMETGTLQKMKSFSSAQAFGITLEKKGGSESPTMEALYVIGNV